MELFDAVRTENASGDDLSDNKDLKVVLQILGTESEDSSDDRRRFSRTTYIVPATVEVTDPMGHVQPLKVYSRDANQWGLGFVAQVVLPVGQSALVQVKGGDGVDVRAVGCIVRCREVLPGWFEGAVLFLDEQPSLAAASLPRQR